MVRRDSSIFLLSVSNISTVTASINFLVFFFGFWLVGMVWFFWVFCWGLFLLYIDQYWKFLMNIYNIAAGTSSLWHTGSAKKGCFVSWCISSSTFLRYPQIFYSTVHIKIRLLPSSLSLRVCMFKCFFLTVHCRAEIIRPLEFQLLYTMSLGSMRSGMDNWSSDYWNLRAKLELHEYYHSSRGKKQQIN